MAVHDVLMNTFEARLQGWRELVVTERAARAAAKAEKESVKHFHLRGPGPGRGHRGLLATYAAEHGCSRSTAWRRLRSSAA